MPLYKRTPFPLVEPPRGLDPDELVFQVRFTKEIFRDYQEYLNRLNLYRQRVWSCKTTGKTNLTYEEALVTEQRAAEKVQQFPKELIGPVLQIIQYSTLSLEGLAKAIYTKLQECLFEGMELQGRKEQSVCDCKILEVIDGRDKTRYRVGWIDEEKKVLNTSVVNSEDLISKKPPLSRNALKAFIRDSTSRNAPWVVRENLAKKHRISTQPPPEELRHGNVRNGFLSNTEDGQNIKAKKKRIASGNENASDMDITKKKAKKEEDKTKEVPIKYPINDSLVQPASDDPVFTDRPALSTDFSMPMDCVGDLLMVWNFCSSFGRLLNLFPFSLGDFENAICHKDSDLILIVETHSALIRLLIKDNGSYSKAVQNKKRESKIKITNWAAYLCDFLESKDSPELSCHVTTIRRGHYGHLDAHVKLAILLALVEEALTTDAIRAKLDECVEQQKALVATKRERQSEKRHKEEKSDSKEIDQRNILQNGKRNSHGSGVESLDGVPVQNQDVQKDGTDKVYSSGRSHTPDDKVKKRSKESSINQRTEHEVCVENGKKLSTIEGIMKKQRSGKSKYGETDMKPEEQKEKLEREMEKLSIRTNSLGKDKDYSRYWFFRREGRLFVESSDSKQWGYYTTKEELDALMGSLNPKGERELALKQQLEKFYHRISIVLQKRSKDVAQNMMLDEGVLRRSTRVRAQPKDSPAMTFLRYINKWTEN